MTINFPRRTLLCEVGPVNWFFVQLQFHKQPQQYLLIINKVRKAFKLSLLMKTPNTQPMNLKKLSTLQDFRFSQQYCGTDHRIM
jgi:hypothetical protein